jgi:hypothetical protein
MPQNSNYQPAHNEPSSARTPAEQAADKIKVRYGLSDLQMAQVSSMVAMGLTFAESLDVIRTEPDSTPEGGKPAVDMNAAIRTALGR